MFEDLYMALDTIESIPEQVIPKACEEYIKCCQQFTHVDTGRLINSYKWDMIDDGWETQATVYNTAPYAMYCEYMWQHYMFHKGRDLFLQEKIFEGLVNNILERWL